MRQTVSANDRYDEQDRAAAGWDAALALPAPDVYRFWHGQPGDPLLWSGILVVDRADRRLYLHALGD
jgi:hypothetical protein